jgi:hypothetical protein
MDTKILKLLGCFLLLFTLTACPGEEDCIDISSITRVDNLITITPLKPTYTAGETISFKLEIPSTNGYFGEQMDLFQKTGDLNGRLTTGYSNLFESNSLIFINGSQSNNSNAFNVIFNPNSNIYQLEIKINLNKKGLYELHTDDYVVFQGSSNCNRFRLDTNIAGWDSEGVISFNVE